MNLFKKQKKIHRRRKQSYGSVQLLSHVRPCDPMDCSTPGLPVHHQLPEFTQTHVPNWKMSVCIPIPKKGNAKECSNYSNSSHTLVK